MCPGRRRPPCRPPPVRQRHKRSQRSSLWASEGIAGPQARSKARSFVTDWIHFYAVISDIHANLSALEKVRQDASELARAEGLPLPVFLCLGDIVDYGPQPNETMKLLLEMVDTEHLVRGNHDDEASRDSKSVPQRVRPEFWPMTLWTRAVMGFDSEYCRKLRGWPEAREGKNNGLGRFKLFHSDPLGEAIDLDIGGPKNWLRLLNRLDNTKRDYGLFGHTHLQAVYARDASRAPICYRVCSEPGAHSERSAPDNASPYYHEWPSDVWLQLPPPPCLINAGSVGQPRDGSEPCAAYLLLRSNADRIEMRWRRVCYDWQATVKALEHLPWPDKTSDPTNGNGTHSSGNGNGKDITKGASAVEGIPGYNLSDGEMAKQVQKLQEQAQRMARIIRGKAQE